MSKDQQIPLRVRSGTTATVRDLGLFLELEADEFEILNLRRWDNSVVANRGVDQVYNLAADMGGIGYITANHAWDKGVCLNLGLDLA